MGSEERSGQRGAPDPTGEVPSCASWPRLTFFFLFFFLSCLSGRADTSRLGYSAASVMSRRRIVGTAEGGGVGGLLELSDHHWGDD